MRILKCIFQISAMMSFQNRSLCFFFSNFESLRPIVDVLELERYPPPTKKLRLFAFNDNDKITITAYGEIFDSMYGRRLAVGGVQWTPQFIDAFFQNATADVPQWAVCYQVFYLSLYEQKKFSRSFCRIFYQTSDFLSENRILVLPL